MKTAATPPWVSTFRQQLVDVVGPEWQVVEHRGRVRLVRSLVGGGKDRLMLTYPWEPRSTVNVLQRVQTVAELVAEGLTLAEANKQIASPAGS